MQQFPMQHGQDNKSSQKASTIKNDCHQPMLKAIVQLLRTRARANLKPTLMKVKSHTGIKGKEMADKLATQAAQRAATNGNFNTDVSQDGSPQRLNDKFWPKHKVTHQNSRGEEITRWQYVRDLKASLKAVVEDNGQATKTLYTSAHGKMRKGTWLQNTAMLFGTCLRFYLTRSRSY